jgi:hypothetical protein
VAPPEARASPIIFSPAPEAPRRPATTQQEAVAGQKQPGDEPEETLPAPRTVEARRDGDATMQPAVQLLLGSLPQPVCHQPEATGYVRRDRRIAVGGGWDGRQFGESVTIKPYGFDWVSP